MDKELLDALGNVSYSLDALVKALESNNNETDSDISKSLKNSQISNQIESIQKVLEDVKDDTANILKKQNELIALQKSNNKSIGGFDFSNKNDIKQGASTIILLAGSILAIGMAFKVIGEVDFASVMALSLSLPIIAHTVGALSKDDNISPNKLFRVSGSLLMLSLTLTTSSYILSKINNISNTQFLTMLGISSSFAIMMASIGSIADKKITIENMIKIPLMMVTLSGAIALSSYALSMVQPLTIPQALTAIAIGGVFALLSMSLKPITSNLNSITPDELLTLPTIMLTLSGAVAVSSHLLAETKPITSIAQFLTIAGISGAFILMSYAIKPIAKNLENLDWSSVAKLPLLFTGMSLAVTGSSYILAESKVIDDSKLLNIVLQSGALSATAIALFPVFKLFGKGNMVKDVAMSVVTLPLIAGAISLSSQVLSLGNYEKYPDLEWSKGVGLSLLAFGGVSVGIGALMTMTAGLGAVGMVAGLASVLGIATTISATSHILNKGNYSNAPKFEWAKSVSLLLSTFGLTTATMGAMIIGTLGFGQKMLDFGSNSVLSISDTIVKSSEILSKGKYTNSVNKEWAEGVSLSLGAFAPIYKMLVADKIMSVFGSGVSMDDYKNAITTISEGIVHSSFIFSSASGVWKDAPTKAWADGVGTAIGAFAPVFKILYEQDIFDVVFGTNVSADDMNNTIDTITKGIIQSAQTLSTYKGIWADAPKKEWAEGISALITAFSEVYKLGLGVFGTIDADDIMDYNKIIAGDTNSKNGYSIIDTIVRMNDKLSGITINNTNTGMKGMLSVLNDYMNFITNIENGDKSIDDILDNSSDITNALIKSSNGALQFATAIDKLAISVSKLDVDKLNAFKNFTGLQIELSNTNKEQFISFMDAFNERTKVMAEIFDTSTLQNFIDKVGNFNSSVNKPQAKNEISLNDIYSILAEIKNVMVQVNKSTKVTADYSNEQRLNSTKTPINKQKQ